MYLVETKSVSDPGAVKGSGDDYLFDEMMIKRSNLIENYLDPGAVKGSGDDYFFDAICDVNINKKNDYFSLPCIVGQQDRCWIKKSKCKSVTDVKVEKKSR